MGIKCTVTGIVSPELAGIGNNFPNSEGRLAIIANSTCVGPYCLRHRTIARR